MKIPPPLIITPSILSLLTDIESTKKKLSASPIQEETKVKLLRISLLKSSLYSARIEGNPLTEQTWETNSNDVKKREITNLLDAYLYVQKHFNTKQKLESKDILNLHHIIGNKCISSAGFYRKEMGAIFNQAGIAIYTPPSPIHISKFINELLTYINKSDNFALVTAFLAHLIFEKIHPFIDGNGRIGRLLIHTILKIKNYEFPLPVSFEEYLDSHKNDYYHALDIGLINTEEYIIFMLQALLEQLKTIHRQIVEEQSKDSFLLSLTPRQEEIYRIIRDHTIVSFDFIKRRFLKVPARTLSYDMNKLIKKGAVLKIGKTKGVYYRVTMDR